ARVRVPLPGLRMKMERNNNKTRGGPRREPAGQRAAPADLREELVHSLQKYVEVDEPEPEAVPLLTAGGGAVDADDTEVTVDRMTEEELLKGLEGLTPPEEQPEEEE